MGSETEFDSLEAIANIVGSRKANSTTFIDLKDGPEFVVYVVQPSDLHFSVFHPERALDFRRLVGPALAMINPSLVLITGDLTGDIGVRFHMSTIAGYSDGNPKALMLEGLLGSLCSGILRYMALVDSIAADFFHNMIIVQNHG